MKRIFLLVSFVAFNILMKAQTIVPTLTSIAPNAGSTGQTMDVMIKGSGTSFLQGITKIDMGPNIYIDPNLVRVHNKEMLTATIKITSDNSKIGVYGVTVTTNNEILPKPGYPQIAFEIFYSFSKLRGVIEVMPVQTLNLSDFDPTNFAGSPNLFYVTIYNDDKVRSNVVVTVTMFTGSLGTVGTMTKTIAQIGENAVLRLTNKDFPKLDASTAGPDLLNKVRQSGMFPPDNYTFQLQITDPAAGNSPVYNEVTILITNPNYKPELISPGNNFNRPPEVVINGYPVFQWFGQADQFDFYLYMVNDGQSPEEAVRNIPQFKKLDNVGNILPYPVYAEQLVDGKTYAWQVIAKVSNSKTTQLFPSEVFWFLHDAPESISRTLVEEEKTITHVKIEPSDAVINAGSSFQFEAVGYDANNMPVEITEMEWKVTPLEGTVDSTGLFVAGLKPGTMAVVVKVNDVEDFATITVKPAAVKTDEQMIDKIMKDLFGLPARKKE
ncbi:MAG: hypothetical protein ACHQK8_03870 [Bacteroidia bacterium]